MIDVEFQHGPSPGLVGNGIEEARELVRRYPGCVVQVRDRRVVRDGDIHIDLIILCRELTDKVREHFQLDLAGQPITKEEKVDLTGGQLQWPGGGLANVLGGSLSYTPEITSSILPFHDIVTNLFKLPDSDAGSAIPIPIKKDKDPIDTLVDELLGELDDAVDDNDSQNKENP